MDQVLIMPQLSFKVAAIELSLFDVEKEQRDNTAFSRLAEFLKLPLIKVIPVSPEELLPQIFNMTEGYDFLMVGHLDSGFYNAEENRKLLEQVLKYEIDIGFGDNYPGGVIAEFFRRETFPVMENIRKQNNITVKRNVFEEIIAVDHNTFDLENHYAEIALRSLRLSFYTDNLQDRIIANSIKSFFSEGTDFLHISYREFAETILKYRHLLRTHPKYYEIAITHRAVQKNIYLPDRHEECDLTLENFRTVLSKTISFAERPVIAFSGFGEMTAHPQWWDLVEEVLGQGQKCILETAAVFWNKEISDYWLKHPRNDLLTIIFKIEAVDSELYASIRGNAFPLTTILDNIEYYLLRNPEHSYVETVKTTATFKHLPAFYDHFSRYTKKIIVGKYNTYCNVLPERRINPMKPYDQIDCWHLKRGMKIDAHGEVWLCKQDINKKHSLGNLITEPIEEIYKRGQVFFEQHVAGWDFCKNCDEFYTYNF